MPAVVCFPPPRPPPPSVPETPRPACRTLASARLDPIPRPWRGQSPAGARGRPGHQHREV